MQTEEQKKFQEVMKKTTFKYAFQASAQNKKVWKTLQKQGWVISDDYSIDKRYKDVYLTIEACIGGFCVYPVSNKTKYLLAEKKHVTHFIMALVEIAKLEVLIDSGHHWNGESD